MLDTIQFWYRSRRHTEHSEPADRNVHKIHPVPEFETDRTVQNSAFPFMCSGNGRK